MERTITVSATGTAEAEPDQARITSGVTTEAPSCAGGFDRQQRSDE